MVSSPLGASTRLQIPAGPYSHVRVSWDGTRLAYSQEDQRDASIWVFDLAGGTAPQRLTSDGRSRFPVWSPDNRIAFQSERDGSRGIFLQSARPGVADVLTKAAQGETHIPESFSPDGKRLLFSLLKDSSYSLYLVNLDDKKAVPFGGVRSAEQINAVFSPNGRWVAYQFNESEGTSLSSTRGVYVQPFPATGARIPLPKRSRFSRGMVT